MFKAHSDEVIYSKFQVTVSMTPVLSPGGISDVSRSSCCSGSSQPHPKACASVSVFCLDSNRGKHKHNITE